MSSAAPAPNATRRQFDERAAARLAERWTLAEAAPWLHGEVARRMAERLPVILKTPESIVEWWAHAGGSNAVLQQAYPKARRVRVEPSAALAASRAQQAAAPWWAPRRWTAEPAKVLAAADVPPASAQLLWANMALHAVADPPALFAQWRRVLEVEGFLMFSTLGPDTLAGLRELYAEMGWGSPGAAFVDMHDIGDMLVHAGFADPVMDQEHVVLTWATPEALLAELRTLGLNADPARHAGLRSPRWQRRLLDALGRRAGADGRIALGFEVVYGHAFNPLPRPKVAAQTHVPLADLRSMVRGTRTSRS
jgi:malonyl-CoA O-methyltransferase